MKFIVNGDILQNIDIEKLLRSSNYRGIVDAPGEFWLECHMDDGTVKLISSRNGTKQCFYTIYNQVLYYGCNVFDLVAKVKIDWDWSGKAIASLAYFGHLLGSETLHSEVFRLGAGEVLTWNGLRLSSEVPVKSTTVCHKNAKETALECLVEFVRKEGDDAIVPLSAGFDSRVILSAFLSLGKRPPCFVMGGLQSTDTVIAIAIAERYSLRLYRAPLPVTDYLKYRNDIIKITSGTKTPDNWHTYIGVRNLDQTIGLKLFPGSNGEYARTFYFDKGLIFTLADRFSRFSIPKFWSEKLKRKANLPESLNENLNYYMSSAGRGDLINWILERYDRKSLGSMIDTFYLGERVRTFISNGLELYSDVFKVRAPFLEQQWINAIDQTPRRMRMNCNWHRFALSKLCSGLLDYPVDDTKRPMGPIAPFRERILGSSHGKTIGYAPDLLGDRDFSSILANMGNRIPELFTGPDMVSSMQAKDKRTRHLLATLLLSRDYMASRSITMRA